MPKPGSDARRVIPAIASLRALSASTSRLLLLRAKALVSASAVAIPIACAPSPVFAQPANPSTSLQLQVGQAHVLDEAGIRRIAVGNGKVIQATALDERQILIIPEAAGTTSLHLWGRQGGPRVYQVNVSNGDTNRLLAEVQAQLGDGANLRSRALGDRVVVEGANLTEEQAQRLSELAKRHPQLIDLTAKIAAERMISMDVRMVEVKRDVLRNIGIKWSGSGNGPSFGIVGDLHRSGALQAGGSATGIAGLDVRTRVAPFATALSLASNFTSALNLLVQNGDAFILAEPQLSCRSGGSARFVAGGEIPIPVSTGLGATSVMFKEYGVKFDVAPVASDSGMIAAKIATEISAINFEVMVREIPGLTKRRAETEVNLRDNETLVIAGLVSDESNGNLDKLAGFGDLPVLGALFRSRQFRDRRTELVVFITPRIISADAPLNSARVEAARRLIDTGRERMKMLE